MSQGPLQIELENGTVTECWDATKLTAYSDCEYLGKLEYEEHLALNEPPVALVFGSGFHKAVEVWTQQRQNPALVETLAVAAAETAFVTIWEKQLPQEVREMLEFSGDRRSVANFKRLFAGYRKKFPLEMFQEIIACERPFTIALGITPAGRKVHWSGVIDRIVRWQESMYYVDLKTSTYGLDAAFFNKFKLSCQIRGYTWVGQQLYREAGEFAGALIQGVQVQAPLKTKVRTADELVQAEVIPLSAAQLEQWRSNTLALIDRIHEARERGHQRNYGTRCSAFGSGCSMKQICWAEPDAEDAVKMTHYKERVWNPLTRDVEEI